MATEGPPDNYSWGDLVIILYVMFGTFAIFVMFFTYITTVLLTWFTLSHICHICGRNSKNMALTWPKHWPNMVLLIYSSWILMIVSTDASCQIQSLNLYLDSNLLRHLISDGMRWRALYLTTDQGQSKNIFVVHSSVAKKIWKQMKCVQLYLSSSYIWLDRFAVC